MCDLIDLDNSMCSPLNNNLASPLIPIPSNVGQSSSNISSDKSKLIVDKYETSLGNNPFDAILDEAIKSVDEEGDPFEIVSREALKKDVAIILEDKNVNITDDLKATYSSQKLEEGKNFDESFPNANVTKPINDMNSLDLSILNLSAMNDMLYETNCDIEEDKISCMALQKVPLYTQQTESDTEKISIDTEPVPMKYMRSRSQSDIMQQCKQYLRQRINSAIETSKTCKISTSDTNSLSSTTFHNFLDKGFIEDQCNNNSVFSNLSNISNDKRLVHNSLLYNSASSIISNNIINCDLLNSCSSEVSCNTDLNEKINNTMNTISINSKLSSPTISVQTQIDIPDLVHKLNAIKMKKPKTQASQIENIENGILSKQIVNNTALHYKNTNGKTTLDNDDEVLDINVCIPEITISKSCSTDSSDSIFSDNNKENEFILDEAKVLARTFEELARRVSGSSLDEFIINDPMWTSELLPAFEDEEVNDLIDLPNREKNNHDISTHKNDLENNIRHGIDKSSFSPITADKKIVSTLLLDLKKIVKTENNFEAKILFDNLEKVLGIKTDKNIELSTHNQKSNDLQKSHENYNSGSDNARSNDTKIHKIEINEDLCQNDRMTDEIDKEVLNDSKKVMTIENKVENDISLINEDTKASLTHTETKKEENNEKAAVELLINLGKVLSAQSEESTTLNLLKNLGEVLHLISQNNQKKNIEQYDVSPINSRRSMVTDKSKTGRKVRSLNVRTLDENMFRRSMLTNRSPNKALGSTSVLKHNGRSQLKDAKKRFSSDSDLTNSASYKNKIAANIEGLKKKATTRKDIQQVNNETNNQEEKMSIKLATKTQLKSKIKTEIINKKGPMKAIIPIGNMQRKSIITSPKSSRNTPSIKINNSMSNSLVKGSMLKKSAKSKNLVSSTPNTPKCKSLIQIPTFQRCDNRLNVSCDISPINVEEEVSSTTKHKVYFSPRRTSQITEFSQISSKKEGNIYKRSPVICKKMGVSQLKSPLKDSNKIITKAKPLNLTAKLRRSNNGSSTYDKENVV